MRNRGVDAVQGSKASVFFSEEKKQKTFIFYIGGKILDMAGNLGCSGT
jgi:hypothetical protein